MQATEQTVADVLDGTIEALTSLDLEQLHSLEKQMLGLAASGASIRRLPPLLERRDRLRRMLEETRSNLDVLEMLWSRKERERWER